ncbi:hypothetical protein KC323_g104 [Hortaea werneckii]|nr:hypothetical protein KC323_g104 [Hortaea werneckii]
MSLELFSRSSQPGQKTISAFDYVQWPWDAAVDSGFIEVVTRRHGPQLSDAPIMNGSPFWVARFASQVTWAEAAFSLVVRTLPSAKGVQPGAPAYSRLRTTTATAGGGAHADTCTAALVAVSLAWHVCRLSLRRNFC